MLIEFHGGVKAWRTNETRLTIIGVKMRGARVMIRMSFRGGDFGDGFAFSFFWSSIL